MRVQWLHGVWLLSGDAISASKPDADSEQSIPKSIADTKQTESISEPAAEPGKTKSVSVAEPTAGEELCGWSDDESSTKATKLRCRRGEQNFWWNDDRAFGIPVVCAVEVYET